MALGENASGKVIKLYPFSIAISVNLPPDVMHAISAFLPCANLKASSVSSVFPEKLDTITSVFSLTNAGKV